MHVRIGDFPSHQISFAMGGKRGRREEEMDPFLPSSFLESLSSDEKRKKREIGREEFALLTFIWRGGKLRARKE